MAKYADRFSHEREDWETPDELFRPLESEFGIDIDVCASGKTRNARCAIPLRKTD